MNLHGQLNIIITLSKQGKQDEQVVVNAIDIDLERPNFAKQMLVGQTPEQSIERITQLMTVCQHAQTVAAKLALGCSITAAEKRAIDYENIEQGFWRLVIDLPKILAVDLPLANFVKFRQAIARSKNIDKNDNNNIQSEAELRSTAEHLFQQLCQLSPEAFSQLSKVTFSQWLTKSDSPMAVCLRQVSNILPVTIDAIIERTVDNSLRLLTPVPDDVLLVALGQLLQADEGFYQQPCLDQQSHETGSFAAMKNHPLFELFLTLGVTGRYASRLLYLAQKITKLADFNSSSDTGNDTVIKPITGQFCLEKKTSLGWVQTARGLLVHLATIQKDEINQYFIVAPTEWNFHPQGTLEKIMLHSSFKSPELAKKAVKLAVIALDPCVEFNVGVTYA